MPDDFGAYDEEVERRIKMAYPIFPRPKAPAKCHKPPAPSSNKEPEYIDEETELSREIAEAARKAGIVTEDMDIWEQDYINRKNRQRDLIEALKLPKPSPPKTVQIMSGSVMSGSGWIGPG